MIELKDKTQLLTLSMEEISNPELVSFERARVEKIGNAIAFIAEGVSVSDKMWETIQRSIDYMPNAEDLKRPRNFDYVNLATDEIAPDLDTKSMVRELKTQNAGSWLTKSIFYWISPTAKAERESFLEEERARRQRNLDEGISQPYLHKERQADDYQITVGRISNNNKLNDPNLLSAINAICTNPNKPFLIVFGHGGVKNGEMGVGEEYGPQVEVRKVLEKMGVESDKYSLIILERCNKPGLKPPILSNQTPIYHVDKGLAGFLSEKDSGFVDPSK